VWIGPKGGRPGRGGSGVRGRGAGGDPGGGHGRREIRIRSGGSLGRLGERCRGELQSDGGQRHKGDEQPRPQRHDSDSGG